MEIASDKFEIISCDSVQVYRGMDIGSGKVDSSVRKQIPHYMLDIVDPDYDFTAGDYIRHAEEAVKNITSRGKIPLFVGGTGLYVDAFIHGLADIPAINPVVRQKLLDCLEMHGLSALYSELNFVDPVFASKIHPNDQQRILRGLEVFRGTGKPLSVYYADQNKLKKNYCFVGLNPPREDLYSNINNRIAEMINSGFLEEVKSLRARGYSASLKSMRSLGYSQLNDYLDNPVDFHETVKQIGLETRHYAKRQLTWFKKYKEIRWFEHKDIEKINDYIYQYLK